MQKRAPSNAAASNANPYPRFVAAFARLLREGRKYPAVTLKPDHRPGARAESAGVMLFSPHPDDECITGGLPLRLLRECRMRVINVAVTQGSRKDRQSARFAELQAACDYLGFDLLQTGRNGLENIRLETRDRDRAAWEDAVETIADILRRVAPRILFLPHANDWNSTHVGVHFLVMDALRRMPGGFHCRLVETEYWGPMSAPNLMIESSPADVADLVTALSLHAGEVSRNPYHLRMPAWMIDNVRRGSELIGGQGESAPDYAFATLYRTRAWKRGGLDESETRGRQYSCDDSLGELFG